MIAYAIEAAKAAQVFDRIIVSTDSEEIAATAKEWGADVPFLRPADLADDRATTVDVLLHADQWLSANDRSYDLICCIYPTVPLLDFRYICDGYAITLETKADGAMSVARADVQPQRALALNGNGELRLLDSRSEFVRSQDLQPVYSDAGQFYWIRADALRKHRSLLGAHLHAIVIPTLANQDINTADDWHMAELKYTQLRTAIMRLRERAANFPPCSSHIVLGTAQIGLHYGVANRAGKPSAIEAKRILETSYIGGVRVFDTAQAYGSSEEALGHFFRANPGLRDWRIITKLSPAIDSRDATAIKKAVHESIARIGGRSIWTLLLHREQQIDEWSGTLGATLLELQHEGLIQNLGVSVYSPSYAVMAVEHPDFAIVEIPANVFDRRGTRSGVNELAHKHRKTILVRSIFLQGLLAMDGNSIPITVARAREALLRLQQFCAERNTSVTDFAYDYVRCRYPNAFIVIGAENHRQAAENARLGERKLIGRDLADQWDRLWPDDIAALINPSTWRLPVITRARFEFVRTFRKFLPI